jgi:hypothetical protein
MLRRRFRKPGSSRHSLAAYSETASSAMDRPSALARLIIATIRSQFQSHRPNQSCSKVEKNDLRDWKMIRSVWLAAMSLAVLGAVAGGKALTAPVALPISDTQVDGNTISADVSHEAMIKADRLEVTYVRQETVRQETPTQPAPLLTEPSIPEIRSVTSPVETRIVGRHWHDPSDKKSSTPGSTQSKQPIASRKGRPADPSDSQAADRSKHTESTKPCNRTSAFSDVLRSLKLSPACDS